MCTSAIPRYSWYCAHMSNLLLFFKNYRPILFCDPGMQVLLSCSHMCCCTLCSRAVKLCPICNNKVSSVIDIRPVGVPPSSSSSLLPQNGTSNAWDMSAVANSVSSIATSVLDTSNGVNSFREGPSPPSSATSQYQGSEPAAAFEGSSIKPANQHYPFRHLPSDQPPPGIPVPKQSSMQSNIRSASPQMTTPTTVTSIPSVPSSVGRPLFLPSDFVPTTMSGNLAPGSNFSPVTASSYSQQIVPSSSASSTGANLATAVNVPTSIRRPAPYRPPGLYRPPDLFARPAAPVVAQPINTSANSDFTSIVSPQWRTYQ